MTSPEVYERIARPGIELAAEADSAVIALQAAGSIFRSYNVILDQAAALEGLEALVLVHQDAEIVDRDLCAKARAALSDPAVGVAGPVGAVGVRGLAWWLGTVTWASSAYRYDDAAGDAVSLLSFNGSAPRPQTGEVEAVDGVLLVLSPWAVRNVRFDESLGQLHGYDVDLCLQVRDAGRKVVTADLRVRHHHSLDFLLDTDTWVDAHARLAEKWEGRMLPAAPGSETADSAEREWERRARRAEAEAAAAHLLVASRLLQADARMHAGERRRQELARTRSWRATEPLRRAGLAVRAARKRVAGD